MPKLPIWEVCSSAIFFCFKNGLILKRSTNDYIDLEKYMNQKFSINDRHVVPFSIAVVRQLPVRYSFISVSTRLQI